MSCSFQQCLKSQHGVKKGPGKAPGTSGQTLQEAKSREKLLFSVQLFQLWSFGVQRLKVHLSNFLITCLTMCALCLCLCISQLTWSTLQQQRFTSHLHGAIKSSRVVLSCSGILLDNSNQKLKGGFSCLVLGFCLAMAFGEGREYYQPKWKIFI